MINIHVGDSVRSTEEGLAGYQGVVVNGPESREDGLYFSVRWFTPSDVVNSVTGENAAFLETFDPYAHIAQLESDLRVAEVDVAFGKVYVKERDFERHKVDKLQIRNDRLTHALNAVADLVGPEVDPSEGTLDEFLDEYDQLRYDIQKALEV